MLSSAAAVGGTVSAGLTSVTGAAGAAGGAIATVGITVAGKVIDDITPDWKDHGKWALDLAGLIKDPLDSYILKVVNKDIHGKELGSRTMSLAHPVIIDEPQDQQVIPWGQPYTIKGRSVRNKTVTVIADGSGQLKNCSGANEDGDWTCPAPTVTGPVTLSATQGGLTGVTTERHYTVSVQPLTIYSPAPGETVINASSPLTGTGQPGAQVAFSGDVTCGTACYTTVAENGNWTFPTQHAAPGTYTVQVVMTPGVRAESDTQSVTYTVSPLVTTPLSVTSPSGGQTLTRNIYSITGKGKPGHSIDVTGIPVAGECHTFADTRTGEWTCGPYEVTERETAQIMVSDSETSESISRSYTLAPHFTVDSPKENEVISGEYTISGRAPSGSVATVGGLGYVADCQATANNSGNWSCPVGGKLYPAVKGDYTLIVRNTAANSKDNPVISRHFTVGDSPIKILWPEETTPVNENNFWVSGTIQNEDKAHITVKETTPGVNPAVTLCEADSDTDYQTWGCQVNKPAGEYTITVSSVGESGTVYESAPTTFSVAPEKVGTTVMSIDRPGEGEIKTGAKYRVYGKINGLDSQNVHYSVEPGVCSSPDMTISYPDWSCTASSAFEGESSSEPKRMTITARESAHGSHDDSRTRHYFVVTSPAISAHLRDKSHPGNKQAH
ncbi:hypothetical protein C3Z09_21465 [Lelliottia aquatilis]|nr:hypothetical protein C3Z09_21465 [Lelliottia aquatilis]